MDSVLRILWVWIQIEDARLQWRQQPVSWWSNRDWSLRDTRLPRCFLYSYNVIFSSIRSLDPVLLLMINLRKHKCHLNWLLWQRLHIPQRLRDSQLLPPEQHDRACHLRTRSQLCWKLLCSWSLTLSVGRLHWRLSNIFWSSGNLRDTAIVSSNNSLVEDQMVHKQVQCLGQKK